MKLTTKGRYAVTAMVDLGTHKGIQPLTDIAHRTEISLLYLEQLFAQLRRADVVISSRGIKGGYALKAPSAHTTIASIINAVDEPVSMTKCTGDTDAGCMANKTRCLTHDLWAALSQHIHTYLNTVSLEDVIQGTVYPKFSTILTLSTFHKSALDVEVNKGDAS
jgi:Rrf2 family transcriptional regulator, iron-sulfur cluster assembly transcription factor